MECDRDMAEGNAVLERYKQKKKEKEQAMLASIKATYMLRSGRNLAYKTQQDQIRDCNDNSKTVTKKKNARIGQQSEEAVPNADDKPNLRGNKRRKGNTEEDSNETNIQDIKGTDTNAVNNEEQSHGRGRKRKKKNNFPNQVEEESKTKDDNRKESIRSTHGTKDKAEN